MTAPIPLADPSGTVRAWACGECGDVAPIRRGGVEARLLADRCCGGCPACHAPSYGKVGLCFTCTRAGRRALAALACIGMAVAAGNTIAFGYARGLQGDWSASPVDGRNVQRVAVTLDAFGLAALCGVSVETVRGWRA